MHRVVIDANVAVSALLSPHGNLAQILNMVFNERLETYYCAEILAEYTKVLARPRFDFSIEDQKHVIEGIQMFGMLKEPSPCDIPFSDESDRVFYEVAKAANAYLVTGNAKHFPDEPFIISPAKCICLLSNVQTET